MTNLSGKVIGIVRCLSGALLLLLSISGCTKPAAPSAVPSKLSSAPAKAPSPPESNANAENSNPPPSVPSRSPDKLPPALANLLHKSPEVSQVSPIKKLPAASSHKLVLFTCRGPLVLHLEITIDGKPQLSAVEQSLDEIVKTAGIYLNGDEITRWTELAEIPRIASGELGNTKIENPAQRKKIVEEFDFNRNGRVERNELVALLTQNNAGGQAFSVQSIREFREADKQDLPLFALFDRDQDGQISEAEMSAAPERLRSRDVDDDEVVSVTNFRRLDADDRAMRRRRSSAADRAFELQEFTLDSIYYSLTEWYDIGDGLNAASFSLTPGLLKQLDHDSSGDLSMKEIAGILKAPSDLRLRINFGQAAATGPQLKSIDAQKLGDDLRAAGGKTRSQDNQITLELPGSEVDFVVDDRTTQPAATKPNESKPNYSALQIEVQVSETEDSLFSWLDANHDERITLREMRGAGERLAELDQDGDRIITAAEIPERLRCKIIRSSRAENAMPAAMAAPQRKVDSKAPRWLTAMDQNGDGEISPREFLGTAEQFSRMDENDDGFLDLNEALGTVPD